MRYLFNNEISYALKVLHITSFTHSLSHIHTKKTGSLRLILCSLFYCTIQTKTATIYPKSITAHRDRAPRSRCNVARNDTTALNPPKQPTLKKISTPMDNTIQQHESIYNTTTYITTFHSLRKQMPHYITIALNNTSLKKETIKNNLEFHYKKSPNKSQLHVIQPKIHKHTLLPTLCTLHSSQTRVRW